MAISDKLTYLNTTKSQLKDQINYGLPTEKQITNQTTFREYVGSIFEAFLEALRTPDTLFNNLPKTSGSGSNITLNGTANAPMRITLNPTAISQDGTPTPDNPQDIHTISGNNSVVVDNGNGLSQTNPINLGVENLIDIYTLNNGYINSSGGTAPQTSGSYERYSPFIKVKPNTEYTFKIFECTWGNFGTNNWIGVGEYTSDSDSSFIQRDVMNTGTQDYYTFTTTATTKYVRISARGLTYATKIQFSEEALWKDKNVYTPFGTNIEYCKIGDYEDKFIRSDGENYFNPTYQTQTIYNAGGNVVTGTSYTLTNDTITISKDYSNYGRYFLNKLSLEAGTYTINFVPSLSSSEKQIIYSVRNMDTLTDIIAPINAGVTITDGTPINFSFTINSTTNICISMQPKTSSGGTLTIREIMLNKGTTALPYTPYGKGWYYKQGIGKATNNTISNGSSYSNIVYFSFPKPVDSLNYIWASRNTQVIYSNAQHSTSGNWNSADNIGKIVGGASEHTFWVGFPVGTTLAQAQEKLANDTLYYIKATPTYTKITGELAEQLEQVYKGMLSYDGTTNISQVNNDLPFELVGSAITK